MNNITYRPNYLKEGGVEAQYSNAKYADLMKTKGSYMNVIDNDYQVSLAVDMNWHKYTILNVTYININIKYDYFK